MAHSLVKIVKIIGSILAGVFLSLLVFVPIIHITDPNGYNILHIDSHSGLPLYNPGEKVTLLTGCFENVAVMNNYGFHGPPVSVEKAKDVFRIVIIGSSYIEARQVQVADMLSTQLEQLLNADPHREYTYEVIPLGFNGNSTFLTALYYKYYGSALKPDLVIDVESGYELLQHVDTPPYDAQRQCPS
jgi:hypothetical protein